MISRRKLDANRRNARKSTGPKGPHRKPEAFDEDADPSGILGAVAIVDGIEKWSDFTSIHQGFRRAWKPVGLMEEVLVEKLTVAYWRMRRILVAESGESGRRLYAAPLRAMVQGEDLRRAANLDELPEQDCRAIESFESKRGAVPDADFIHAMTGYEAAMERQFYRAARTLVKLQAIRLGDFAPPTIEMEYEPF